MTGALRGFGKGSKRFFFEKKKQKTFTLQGGGEPPALPHSTDQKNKSFLLLFLKKEALAYCLSSCPMALPPHQAP
jgi:hypothetical protein